MPIALLHILAAIMLAIAGAGTAEAACTTSSQSLTFASSSSYAVRSGSIANVSGLAGLACSGSLLSALGGGYARATVTSANGFQLKNGG